MQKNYNVLSRSGFSTTATAIVPMTYYSSLLHSFSFVFFIYLDYFCRMDDHCIFQVSSLCRTRYRLHSVSLTSPKEWSCLKRTIKSPVTRALNMTYVHGRQ